MALSMEAVLQRSVVVVVVVLSCGVLCAQAAYPWRTSLDNCWTDATCQRALIVSHGGDWNLQWPYDSQPAFENAFNEGSDAVKGDFRVSSDGIGVVCHSSPIEWYESPMCTGVKVEDTPAATITKCPMALTNYTFVSVPDLLAWADGKVIVMLCVKRSEDLGAAIQSIIKAGAQHRAFLEVHVQDVLNVVRTLPGWDQVYYLAEGKSAADLTAFLACTDQQLLRRTFTFEFDPSWKDWGVNATDVIVNQLHARGVRSLAATSEFLPSVVEHEELWVDVGFDVVYTYDTVNAIAARTAVDQARGISPP